MQNKSKRLCLELLVCAESNILRMYLQGKEGKTEERWLLTTVLMSPLLLYLVSDSVHKTCECKALICSGFLREGPPSP